MSKRGIIILAGLALALGLCACFALTAGFAAVLRQSAASNATFIPWGNRFGEFSDEVSQTVAVQSPITLTLDITAGNVTVQTGQDGQVAVRATRRVWAPDEGTGRNILNNMKIDVRPAGNQVSISGAGAARTVPSSRSPQMDLVITVPKASAIDANLQLGRLQVTGTQGDAHIQSNMGEITLTGVMPAKSLWIKTTVASVTLQGPLANSASYSVTSDVGQINLVLPDNSAFKVDARSDLGNVRIDFPVAGERFSENPLSKALSGSVGSSPNAALYLRSRVGNIAVTQAR